MVACSPDLLPFRFTRISAASCQATSVSPCLLVFSCFLLLGLAGVSMRNCNGFQKRGAGIYLGITDFSVFPFSVVVDRSLRRNPKSIPGMYIGSPCFTHTHHRLLLDHPCRPCGGTRTGRIEASGSFCRHHQVGTQQGPCVLAQVGRSPTSYVVCIIPYHTSEERRCCFEHLVPYSYCT